MLAGIVSALPAEAQICAGRASFNIAPTHVGLDAGVSGSSHGAGLAVAHGSNTLFAAGSVATHSVDNAGAVRVIAGTLGADPPLTPDNKIHVCPTVTVGHVTGSASSADRSRFGMSIAGDAGMLIVNTAALQVIPTIGLDLRFGGPGRTAGVFVHPERRHHTFSGGFGFVFRNRLSLVPAVVVPFGPIRRSALQLTVGYSLPRRPS